MKITIDVLGTVAYYSDFQQMRAASNFPSGKGMYLMEEDGASVGLVAIDGFTQDGSMASGVIQFFFPPATMVQNAMHERDADIMQHMDSLCDKVCRIIDELAVVIQDQQNITGTEMHDSMAHLEHIIEDFTNGGGGNGVSEKTLLEALRITNTRHCND